MFENPGQKLKSAAIILFIIIIIVSIIVSIILATKYGSFISLGSLILGPIVGYINCLIIYGLGELIENSAKSNSTKKAEERIRKEAEMKESEDDEE